MAEAAHAGALRRILLATDFSARGDRALERALAIAQTHEAQLLVLHVVETLEDAGLARDAPALPSWRRPPDAAATLKRAICQGLREDLGEAANRATVLIEEGEPAPVIERIVLSESVDLVVAGVARESPFARQPVVLGRTLEQLLRRLPTPILIVRNRARDAYHHIVVTTDFSVPSAHALQTAVRFFPDQTLHLLHAFPPPSPSLVPETPRHVEGFGEAQAEELRKFLDSVFLPAGDRMRLVPLIEPGLPQEILRDYVQQRGADLVVLGTRGRGAVTEAILGSTTKSILAIVPCDALVVRGPRP